MAKVGKTAKIPADRAWVAPGALEDLETFNKRWFDVVTYRFYADRSVGETAELLGVGQTTVKADWTSARAWLHRRMEGSPREDPGA